MEENNVKTKENLLSGTAKSLLPLLAAFAVQILVLMIVMFVGIIVIASSNMPQNGEGDLDLASLIELAQTNANLSAITLFCATGGCFIVGYLWYRKKRDVNDRSAKEALRPKMIFAMLLLGIVFQILSSLAVNFILMIVPEDMSNNYIELIGSVKESSSVFAQVFNMAAAVILAPLAEELLFRGLTLGYARKVMPFVWANVLQALAFSIYHLNPIQMIYTFVIGLALGYVRNRYKSLWASVLLHFSLNLSLFVLSVPEMLFDSEALILILDIVITVGSAAGAFILMRKDKDN